MRQLKSWSTIRILFCAKLIIWINERSSGFISLQISGTAVSHNLLKSKYHCSLYNFSSSNSVVTVNHCSCCWSFCITQLESSLNLSCTCCIEQPLSNTEQKRRATKSVFFMWVTLKSKICLYFFQYKISSIRQEIFSVFRVFIRINT